jgi:citrate synthase
MARMLESAEAARRLGVKLPTLYAYVSRGLLRSHPSPDRRHSLFEADEVEALAKRSRGGRTSGTRLATVTTGVTRLDDDRGPLYRGRPATELAGTTPYEKVAALLWGEPMEGGRWEPARLRPPTRLGTLDRLRWSVLMAGAADPLRADLRPEAVTAVARRLGATMAAAVSDGTPSPGSVAEVLAAGLVARPDAAVVHALDAALVLLADHELATSTVAVRVAASTRADLYDAVLAGLAVLAGPLHGGASQLAWGLLHEAARVGPERALDETLRWQQRLPGFGHTVYTHGDPRYPVLEALFREVAPASQVRLLAEVVGLAAERRIPLPNVDLGLAALTLATGMPDDAGRTIFSVARVAGWTAHYLEELEERPIRYRARAVYAER